MDLLLDHLRDLVVVLLMDIVSPPGLLESSLGGNASMLLKDVGSGR